MNAFQHFLNMGGYAFYVWTAYGITFALLAAQWLIPWRKWRNYVKGCQKHHE
jgi:heme exporter protein D